MENKFSMANYAHYSYELGNRLILVSYYLPNIIKLKWWGIQFSGKIKFDGLVRFRRLPGSSIKIGEGCYFSNRSRHNLIGINHACIVSTQTREAKIEIGNNCGFSGSVVGAFSSIKIGNNVKCGANTLITDGDWHLEDPRSSKPKEIVIGDNVWLGVNTIVLKGVTIGENSLIGANSVVTKSIPPNVIAVGNPCVVVKELKL